MSKRLKPLLAMMLVIVMSFSSAMSVCAADVVITESSGSVATISVVIDGSVITSTFVATVQNTIPIVVDGGTKEGDAFFDIDCSGDIAADEILRVSAEKSFIMSQPGKDNLTVNVLLSEDGSFTDTSATNTTDFSGDGWDVDLTSSQISSGHTVKGSMHVTNVEAGAYSGLVDFKIALY